jgi:alkaline phosphatase
MKNQGKHFQKVISIILIIGLFPFAGYTQEEYKDPENKSLKETYSGGTFYEVKNYSKPKGKKFPKNIILMIGDGMGLSQTYSAMTANGGHLFLENFKSCGFSKT